MNVLPIDSKSVVSVMAGAALCLFSSSAGWAAAAPQTTALGSFAAGLRGPVSVAAGRDGLVYAAEPSAGCVTVFDAFGRLGSKHSGLARPIAIGIDPQGQIYVAEEGNRSVTIFDPQWQILGRLGQGTGEFALPNGLAAESAGGRIYVCDGGADVVAVYEGGQRVLSLGGSGSGPGQLSFPAGVCLTAQGEVAVLDQGNDRVQVFSRTGLFLRMFSLGTGDASSSAARTGRSQGMAADRFGRIFVADTFNGTVRVFDPQGNLLSTIGEFGVAPGRLRSPVGLAVDAAGRLLVASANNSRIESFGLDGYVQLTASPSAQTVATGASVSFAVTVNSPGPLAFQWRAGTNVLSDDADTTGTATPTLGLRSVAKSDSGIYSVTVTTPSGSFVSPAAVLQVIDPPRIRVAPADLTVLAGTAATFAVSASGDELTYQWQREDAPLAGATAGSLVVANAQPGDIAHYSVTIGNRVGAASSAPALLNVLVPPSPPQIDSAAAPAPDGTVRLAFRCEAGFNYSVEVTRDLASWSPLTEVFSLNGYVEFQDAQAAGESVRLYRLRWLP